MNAGLPGALELKVELQSLGIRVPWELRSRAGGAGPADGITLFIEELVATVPTGAWYVERSPFSLSDAGGAFELLKGGRSLGEGRPAPDPAFYTFETEGLEPYHKIALRHGRDGIGSTVAQGCAHGPDSCKFCAISLSKESGATLARKSPAEVAEVAVAAQDEGYTHIVLTTGSVGSDVGIGGMVECAAAVKARTGMRIHVQFEPPEDMGLIERFAQVSDSAAINIECFDRAVLENIAPGKARTGLARYSNAWRKAVDAYGPGQVTSFIILGLGESDESVLEGAKVVASMGVYPFLVPLRPLRGTPLETWSPPQSGRVMRLFEAAAATVQEARLSASSCLAGCVRCGACSAITDLTG
jgi:radical SAM protein (TIGR04043 family)